MQPIKEAEVPNLLKEIGLSPTFEDSFRQVKDGKLSFPDFTKFVNERLSIIAKEVSTSGDHDPNSYINLSDQQVCMHQIRLILIYSC